LTEIDFRAGHPWITFGKAQYQTAPRPEKGPRPAPPVTALPNKIFLGLVEANRQQLLEAGVPQKSIWTSPLCTNCNHDLLFSYRGENGETGRMMGVVGIRD